MTQGDYTALLQFRTVLRHFLHWSEEQARTVGVPPGQHQLLLAVKGHDDPAGPTIGQVAEYLAVRHHSAVESVDRAERAGHVQRVRYADDHRVIRLRLTTSGEDLLLSVEHLAELAMLGSLFSAPG